MRIRSALATAVRAALVFVACGACGERWTVEPAEIGGFGHVPVRVHDADCDLPAAPERVSVAGVEAVLVRGGDPCSLELVPQGGASGPAPISIAGEGRDELTVEGLRYAPSASDAIFARTWAIGGSLGTGMVSMYLAYDPVVEDGLVAFVCRQAGAFCPHPLVRREGIPKIVTLADLDLRTANVGDAAFLTEEVLQHLLLGAPLRPYRLNADTVHHNQSVPGMHDVTWPYRPRVYGSGPITTFENLLRFPDGVPANPEPIMTVIRRGDPTFVLIVMDMIAYALDHVWIGDARLSADFDRFLDDFASMPSAPIVVGQTMPDTASLPARVYTTSERYEAIRINNLWRAAFDRQNAELAAPRFFLDDLESLYFAWLEPGDTLDIGGHVYPLTRDPSGWPAVAVPGAAPADTVGLGRFHGFFTLDHVHPTATGHALLANHLIATLNASLGARLAAPIPRNDVAAVHARDNGTRVKVAAEAARLGLGDLGRFLDPAPPKLSPSERCAITGGGAAAPEGARCPATIELEAVATSSGAAPRRWVVTVRDASGAPYAGATVGAAAIPPTDSALLRHYPTPGRTGEDGRLEITVDSIDAPQRGGMLRVVSGRAVAMTPLD